MSADDVGGDTTLVSPLDEPTRIPRSYTRLVKPVTRVLEVDGVKLMVSLGPNALHYRVLGAKRNKYSLSYSGLFHTAVVEARRRHRTRDAAVPQEEMDLRVPRPDRD